MIRPAHKSLRTRSQIIGKKEIRLLVVGSSGVGKTTLCNCFFEDHQNQGEETREKYIQIDNEFIKISISDIVGKQSFYACDNPYDGYDAILVMYDITELKSFTDLKTMWLPDIFLYCNIDTQIIIIGNKKDQEIDRIITRKEAEQFAKDRLCQFYEISTEDDSCQLLFDCISRDFLQCDIKIRMLIVGDQSVGKTTFIKKFTLQDPTGHDFMSAITTRFEMEKIKYEIIMIDWGFYNKLLQTNPAISRTIEAILIVYDITNEESFQNIHRKYYPLINNKFSDVTGVIIGYKTDLEAQRKITMDDALTLTDWLGYKYVEMSSKDTEDHSSIIKALAHSIRINRLKIEQSYE
ncbi:hypothetical protein, conserved [Entamoeba dispar SAW760]|uniref:small monomeric GTPase n=1 Tax=Entamoeba dispar (strain ATCC PRA-260 / SAW760) TaxID=370354 RepID=B0EEY9_ENTDS|nr:uncharacterized protein EDI_126470 [Entamoeba dispar SAW760]EDR26906.1 hypothetical protein, conserved [Entamoeba dispar SAW760]|eukprot:EDR26906.1 hypothetical protein, conserved [Entamoeba dispar SAW760]